jgi:hypothetical protein
MKRRILSDQLCQRISADAEAIVRALPPTPLFTDGLGRQEITPTLIFRVRLGLRLNWVSKSLYEQEIFLS